MNVNCIDSFLKSTDFAGVEKEVILVESYSKSDYNYNFKNIIIVKPISKFNFHKFLNIGIGYSNGDYFVLSNNDVVFEIEFVKEILKVADLNKRILSFSPYDTISNKLPKYYIEHNDYIMGYEIQKHLTGWCLVLKKKR